MYSRLLSAIASERRIEIVLLPLHARLKHRPVLFRLFPINEHLAHLAHRL